MRGFLLDTNAISDFMKEHASVTEHFYRHTPNQLAVSSVTVFEIEYGFERQPSARQKYEAVWTQLQADLNMLVFDGADARQTALIRHYLRQQGKPIGPYDLQLAGMALNRQLTLVTNNTAEFGRVPGLQYVDWRVP